MADQPNSRRYDLDWLRVFAFGLLILFHTGMMFVSWDWHVKNLETSPVLEVFMRFLHQWRMPLLFFISGGAVRFALNKYGTGGYVRERFRRVLLPLAAGMLLVIPPQVYYERMFQGFYYQSYGHFFLTVFTTGSYPAGNLSWHHLWYLPYIFVYSLLLLPLFLFLRRPAGRRLLAGMHRFLAAPGRLLLPALPLAAGELLLRPFWPEDAHNLWGDWANFTFCLLFFLTGYLLCSDEEIWPALEAYRHRALLLAAITMTLLSVCWYSDLEIGGTGILAYRVLHSLNSWCWVLLLLGFGRRWLSFNHPWLKYATEAVYPFYILHQTVIVILGFYIARWNLGLWWKYLLVAGGMMAATGVMYELVIRRVKFLRPLFGLRSLPRKVAPSHSEESLAPAAAGAAAGGES